MDTHGENGRAEFHHRLSVTIRFLAAAEKKLVAAKSCPDYEEAKREVDRVMKALQSFVNSARPPGEPPLL